MRRMLHGLVEHLRKARDAIVVSRECLVENYNPTYGLQEPRTEYIDCVDFDELLSQIDVFAANFKDKA